MCCPTSRRPPASTPSPRRSARSRPGVRGARRLAREVRTAPLRVPWAVLRLGARPDGGAPRRAEQLHVVMASIVLFGAVVLRGAGPVFAVPAAGQHLLDLGLE